jgi:hypothetical protein
MEPCAASPPISSPPTTPSSLASARVLHHKEGDTGRTFGRCIVEAGDVDVRMPVGRKKTNPWGWPDVASPSHTNQRFHQRPLGPIPVVGSSALI